MTLSPSSMIPPQIAALHNMRIAAKRLRTVWRYSASASVRISRLHRPRFKELQEQIGAIHDCDVLIDLLRRHLSVLAQRDSEALLAVAAEPQRHKQRMAPGARRYPQPGPN